MSLLPTPRTWYTETKEAISEAWIEHGGQEDAGLLDVEGEGVFMLGGAAGG